MPDMLSPEARKILHPGPCVYLLLTTPYIIREPHCTIRMYADQEYPPIPGVDWFPRHTSNVLETKEPPDAAPQSYIGSSNNIVRRFREHNSGKALATRGRTWVLVAVAYMPDLRTARHVERWFKRGDTAGKKRSLLNLWQRWCDPDQVGRLVASRVLNLQPLPPPRNMEAGDNVDV